MLPDGFRIRPAEPRDDDACHDVCLKTGDGGGDATHQFADPRALGRIFVGPYLKYQPDLAWVLEDAQGVCGYTLAALDSRGFFRRYVEEWLPPLQQRFPEPTGDRTQWNRDQQCYHDYHHPDVFCPEPYEHYPSHLHIDLVARAQGKGIGGEMMQVLLDALRASGTPGVHLGTGVENARAIHFYRKLDFHELTRTRDCVYMGLRFR